MPGFERSYAASAPANTEKDADGQAKTYRIGEVADMLKLKSYVLRFWESEFPQLVPLRTEKGQRLYTEEHVNLLRQIQALLHERGMTIEGAKRILAQEEHGRIGLANLVPETAMPGAAIQRELLRQCVEELEVLKRLLLPPA